MTSKSITQVFTMRHRPRTFLLASLLGFRSLRTPRRVSGLELPPIADQQSLVGAE